VTVYDYDPDEYGWRVANPRLDYDPDVGQHSAGEDRYAEWLAWHDAHCTDDHSTESYLRAIVTIDPHPFL